MSRVTSYRTTTLNPAHTEKMVAQRQDMPHARKSIRVFLVDDHELVRRGLMALIGTAPALCTVGEASTAAEALERIPLTSPDVVLLDVRLGGASGVDLCRRIRTQHPSTAVLMLTSYTDVRAEHEAARAGASGYFLKNVAGETLIDAVMKAAAGESLMAAGSAPESSLVDDDPRWKSLSQQERRVLQFIGDGLTNRQIGDAMFLSEKTVKHYVTTLLRKLGLERRTQAATFITHLRDEGLTGTQ